MIKDPAMFSFIYHLLHIFSDPSIRNTKTNKTCSHKYHPCFMVNYNLMHRKRHVNAIWLQVPWEKVFAIQQRITKTRMSNFTLGKMKVRKIFMGLICNLSLEIWGVQQTHWRSLMLVIRRDRVVGVRRLTIS